MHKYTIYKTGAAKYVCKLVPINTYFYIKVHVRQFDEKSSYRHRLNLWIFFWKWKKMEYV